MAVNASKLASRAGKTGRPVLQFTDEAWRRIALAFELSGRELEIVRQIFADHKEAAIADELGISPHTVHTYVARAYRKLNVASRLQLVVRIVELQDAPVSAPRPTRRA